MPPSVAVAAPGGPLPVLLRHLLLLAGCCCSPCSCGWSCPESCGGGAGSGSSCGEDLGFAYEEVGPGREGVEEQEVDPDEEA